MKNTLFLTEQLIAILIFSICLTVCVNIFIKSYSLADGSKDLNNALILAKSAAEAYKATHGNAEMTALLLDGKINSGIVQVHYDEDLNICKNNAAIYVMNIREEKHDGEPAALSFGGISVQKDGEELISFTVAARSEAK